MAYEPQTDDEILRQVLYRDHEVRDGDRPIVDDADELFDLFLAGKLEGEDQQAYFRYLDANPSARAAVGSYMAFLAEADPEPMIPPSDDRATPMSGVGGRFWQAPRLFMALAASLLVAAGVIIWRSGSSDPIMLAERGTLLDIGAELGGISIRGEQPIPIREHLGQELAALERASHDNVPAMLNRGYILLELGRTSDAADAFQQLIDTNPNQVYAWLGHGMALYVDGDFAAAETAFRRCLEIDPNSVAARVNLAMTLTELDRPGEALVEWQQVDIETLADEYRANVIQEIERLQEFERR